MNKILFMFFCGVLVGLMIQPINVLAADCKIEKISNKFIGGGSFASRRPVIRQYYFKNGGVIECKTHTYETFNCILKPEGIGFNNKKFISRDIKEIVSQMDRDAKQLCIDNTELLKK